MSPFLSRLPWRDSSPPTTAPVPSASPPSPLASASLAAPSIPADAPRILVVGAGSRGHAYARPIADSRRAHIVAVCEPDAFKRRDFGRRFIWGDGKGGRGAKAAEAAVGGGGGGCLREPRDWEAFASWEEWIAYERVRRRRVADRELAPGDEEFAGVDAVLVCVLDELHKAVCEALAPLGVHVLCEKPLATRLEDVVGIYRAVTSAWETLGRSTVFGICHVLRYSEHNTLLRKLIREDGAVGEVLSVEHTEPVGWWHFSHSYVRGNWRREDTSAPSLLTKSCHDIDFLLWLLCSPISSRSQPHLPSSITSTGSRNLFRRARKPRAAGGATNCLSCPIERDCNYSARRIYVDGQLAHGNTGWPVKIVVPDIEDTLLTQGRAAAEQKLLNVLAQDYDGSVPDAEVRKRNWFGRCVWESDNSVCDDQTVTITWDDDDDVDDDDDEGLQQLANGDGDSTGRSSAPHVLDSTALPASRGAKTATFHMVAATQAICERRGVVYGTRGELAYDSSRIALHDFATGKTTRYSPARGGGGHGGGDAGLALNFVRAVAAVKKGEMDAVSAQAAFLGCSLEELVRSHVAVFAAEEARRSGGVVGWKDFWEGRVEGRA